LKVSKAEYLGFTLIEMLAVLAIISILMGLVLSGGEQAKKRARIYKTKAMIASIDTALALYHTDFGAYPAAGNQNLVNLLADAATYSANNDWHGSYMSFKSEDLSGVMPNATVIDPWGHDYEYSLGTVPAYKIWSKGPDGTTSTDDDIISW
jgi:general secretion pathway protein G